jgi:hypothetical protein
MLGPLEDFVQIIKNTEGKPSRISGLYQGDAFTGKTEAVCSWPDVLVVNFDPDSQTAQRNLKSNGGNVVGVVELSNWSDYVNKIEPHVKDRSLHELVGEPVQTIAIDTISLAAQRLSDEIQGSRDKLRIQDYLLLATKLTSATITLTDATKDSLGKPAYHVLFTSHMQTDQDDDGVITGYRPAIPGKFRNLLPRLMGFAFICENMLESVREEGKPASSRAVWRVRTVPPTKLHMCGDRIARKDKRLPAVCSGLYPDLMKAWEREA